MAEPKDDFYRDSLNNIRRIALANQTRPEIIALLDVLTTQVEYISRERALVPQSLSRPQQENVFAMINERLNAYDRGTTQELREAVERWNERSNNYNELARNQNLRLENQNRVLNDHEERLNGLTVVIERLKGRLRMLSPHLYVVIATVLPVGTALFQIDDYRRARVLTTMVNSLANGSNPLVRIPMQFPVQILASQMRPITNILEQFGFSRLGSILMNRTIIHYGWPSQRAMLMASTDLTDGQLAVVGTTDTVLRNISNRMLDLFLRERESTLTSRYIAFGSDDFSAGLRNFITTQLLSVLNNVQTTDYEGFSFSREWVYNVVNVSLDVITRPANYERLLEDSRNGTLQPSHRLAGLIETITITVPTILMIYSIIRWIGARYLFRNFQNQHRRLMIVMYSVITMTLLFAHHVAVTQRQNMNDLQPEWALTPPTVADVVAEAGLDYHGALITISSLTTQPIMRHIIDTLANNPYSALVIVTASALHGASSTSIGLDATLEERDESKE